MSTDPPELHEDVELELEHRRYLLDTFGRLDRITHYELLGVPRTADKKAVKRAYFKLAALVHPDRYYTKKLGSYKARLEAIFARTTEAHDTLTTPDRRKRYDAALGPAGAPTPVVRGPVSPEVAAKRQAALAALKERFAGTSVMAKRYADAGAVARAAGDMPAALEAYEMALSLTPRDAALQAAFAQVKKASEGKPGETFERQAMLEERFGHWAEAVKSWERVAEARPDDEAVRERLALAQARARNPA